MHFDIVLRDIYSFRLLVFWGGEMKLVKLKLQTRLIQPLTVGRWMHLDLQLLKSVGEADSLPGSPKMQRVEMTSQQHRGTTPWILQASEPQRLRGLNILQINNECFRWQALTWAFTSTKTLHWSLTSAMMMLMRWKSMIWSFMMINFFRRTIHVWLTMQTCPRSWINLLFLTQSKNQNWVLMSSSRFVRT